MTRNAYGNYDLPNGLLIAKPFEGQKLWTIWSKDRWRIKQIDSAKTKREAVEKAKKI